MKIRIYMDCPKVTIERTFDIPKEWDFKLDDILEMAYNIAWHFKDDLGYNVLGFGWQLMEGKLEVEYDGKMHECFGGQTYDWFMKNFII